MDTPGHGHKPLTKAGVQAKTWVHVSAFADKRGTKSRKTPWGKRRVLGTGTPRLRGSLPSLVLVTRQQRHVSQRNIPQKGGCDLPGWGRGRCPPPPPLCPLLAEA